MASGRRERHSRGGVPGSGLMLCWRGNEGPFRGRRGFTQDGQQLGVGNTRRGMARVGVWGAVGLPRHPPLGFGGSTRRRLLRQECGNGCCGRDGGRSRGSAVAASWSRDARGRGLRIVLDPKVQEGSTHGSQGAKSWQDRFGKGATNCLPWSVYGPRGRRVT